MKTADILVKNRDTFLKNDISSVIVRREYAIKSMIRGAAAGTVATAAMSAIMFGARRSGVMGTMPPEKITASFLNRAGIKRSRKQQDALAVAIHFIFGAGGGAIFGLAPERLPVPPVPLGMAYGSAIWAVSYMGWVPMLRIMPPPHRDQPGRQGVMLLGHLVYGGVLGVLTRRAYKRAAA
jgi:hypothetical protein